jgi:hypothetical protein
MFLDDKQKRFGCAFITGLAAGFPSSTEIAFGFVLS